MAQIDTMYAGSYRQRVQPWIDLFCSFSIPSCIILVGHGSFLILLTKLQFIWSDFYGWSWFLPLAAGAERSRLSFGLVWLYPSNMAEQRVYLYCFSHWYYCCLYYSYFLPVFKHKLFWETFRPSKLLSLLASTTVNNKHCINCFTSNLIVYNCSMELSNEICGVFTEMANSSATQTLPALRYFAQQLQAGSFQQKLSILKYNMQMKPWVHNYEETSHKCRRQLDI